MKKSIYTILITAGRGPQECTFVVAEFWKKLSSYLKESGCHTRLLEKHVGKFAATYSSILIEVRGTEITEICTPWIGTIQWIGKSPFRKNHKRKNWFIGCYSFESVVPKAININEVTIKNFRASGPGGQHRNKVETAVRLTHKHLGIMVEASEHRSQHQNKIAAFEKLTTAIQLKVIQEKKNQIEKQWKQAISIERGNPIKTFKGNKFTPIQ